MEELEKNQKVGEIITQADQTISSSPSPSPTSFRRVRSAAATATAEDVDNGITKVTTQCEEAVSKIILKSIPSDSQITFVRFEGPNIALYTKNPKFALTELTYFLSSLSKTLKKRFIIRTDPSSRLPEDQTRQAVVKLLPKDVQVSAIFCDDATGEVVLEVSKPEAIDPNMLIQIAQSTGWIAHTRRSPHIPSSTINTLHSTLKSSAKERTEFLQKLGKRVFREPLIVSSVNGSDTVSRRQHQQTQQTQQTTSTITTTTAMSEPRSNKPQSWSTSREEVMLFCLGGVKQVGRSCFVVVTPETKVMLDCGINPGEMSGLDAYPRLDWFNFDLDDLDAVVISHAHIDHQGFLPTLFKYGYRGPVYCTEPTLPLMTLLQMDSVKIANNNGTYLPYSSRDVNEVIKHCITLPYGKPTDISPDVTITLNNAGHIMGSATVHLNISGAHNILYSGDYKYAKTQLLDSAVSIYPRVETLITESTYGNTTDVMPDQQSVYRGFTESINKTLTDGGKVLVPVPAVGRAQEIMLVMAKEMKEGRLIESPIYIEGMISEASAIHMSYAHYLGSDVRKSVSQGINPFQSEYFTMISGYGKRDDILNDENPAIVMATSGMLEGGPSVEYFKELAPNPKNKIMFVSYQINGTLGRRVLDGVMSEVSMMDKSGKVKVVPVRCQTQKIDGFSGHSDFNQIMNFVSRIRPKRVLVNHGEKSKSENVASAIYSRLKIRSGVPDNREIVRLR
ncbi:MAG: beta-lactamase domain protein [Nitrososphaera sp.]|jgi:KH/beta-lactamase-domain protein|nr:beta-lactamase domain protein [Nitrososphaera sp.]